MNNKQAIEKLNELKACQDALDWCSGQEPQQAWDTCERADWMLWLCGKLSGESETPERRKLVLCACKIAHTTIHLVQDRELRPLKAIEMAEAWARQENGVTLQNVRDAAYAAYTAAYTAA